MHKGQHRKPRHTARHRKPAPATNAVRMAAPIAVPALLLAAHHAAAPHHPDPINPAIFHPAVAAAPATVAPYHAVAMAHHSAPRPHHYTVKPGDTLSIIAKREYGSRADWPSLWWDNKRRVRNPNMIVPGEKLTLGAWHKPGHYVRRVALAAIPVPIAPPVSHAVLAAAPPAAPAAPAPPAATQPVVAAAGAPGSFQACVIARESGGNPSAVNPSSGAGGLYQFLPSTWAALGHSGLPENASVAEQNQAFQQAYSQSGTSPWAPYDGC